MKEDPAQKAGLIQSHSLQDWQCRVTPDVVLPPKQTNLCFVLEYQYVPDILSRRDPFRPAHLAHSDVYRKSGKAYSNALLSLELKNSRFAACNRWVVDGRGLPVTRKWSAVCVPPD
jgi:hypothetical protein